MVKEPIAVTDEAFEKVVLQSDLPVIVDFWAEWCGPCKMIAPTLHKIAEEYAGRLIVAKVDTDKDTHWAMEYDVRGIPTLLFIANGVVAHRQVGTAPETFLRDMVEEFLNTTGKVRAN
jgi:thioredoxin 1